MKESRQARPVIFGEILFDRFPDGASVLGGAPFNVAWHLQGFGAAPLFISRIGRDELGTQVQAVMAAWGMDGAGLQLDERHPTGVVEVTLQEGQPSYSIVPDQAYDFVDSAAACAVLADNDSALLYHGTLALRNPVSRTALEALRLAVQAPVCVDINLRAPWWDSAIVHDALHGAAWVKLNNEELATLSLPPPAPDADELAVAAQALRQRYGLELLIVTRGAAGAWMVMAEGLLEGTPRPVDRIVDTVGAGDAFAAVALLGLLRNWPLEDTLQRALAFAAHLCTVRGATIRDPELYSTYLQQWEAGLG
ncbi:MAG: carbohydrate kinase [Gammaproteobacteria bacterium]